MQQTSRPKDIRNLDDPALLAERRRLRELLARAGTVRGPRGTGRAVRRAHQGARPARSGEVDGRVMRAGIMTEDRTRKRLLAIEVLLEDPEAIPDPLEAELYAYRDELQALHPEGR